MQMDPASLKSRPPRARDFVARARLLAFFSRLFFAWRSTWSKSTVCRVPFVFWRMRNTADATIRLRYVNFKS